MHKRLQSQGSLLPSQPQVNQTTGINTDLEGSLDDQCLRRMFTRCSGSGFDDDQWLQRTKMQMSILMDDGECGPTPMNEPVEKSEEEKQKALTL